MRQKVYAKKTRSDTTTFAAKDKILINDLSFK